MKKTLFVLIMLGLCLTAVMGAPRPPVVPDVGAFTQILIGTGAYDSNLLIYHPYPNDMNLSPSLNQGSVTIAIEEHLGNMFQLSICKDNSGTITLKDGQTFNKLFGNYVLAISLTTDYYPTSVTEIDEHCRTVAGWPGYNISHAFEALSVEQLVALGTQMEAPYTDTDGVTHYSVKLNVRIVGWADTGECCCPLVWYYGDPDNTSDDWLYLVTVGNDEKIYLPEDASKMFRNAVASVEEIHFSDRIKFENVKNLSEAFEAYTYDDYNTFVCKSIDLGNCDLSNVTTASNMFSYLHYLIDVDISTLPATANLTGLFNYYSQCQTCIVSKDVFNNFSSLGITLPAGCITAYKNNEGSIEPGGSLKLNYYIQFGGNDIPINSAIINTPSVNSLTARTIKEFTSTQLGEMTETNGNLFGHKFSFEVAASQMTKDLLLEYTLYDGGPTHEKHLTFADLVKKTKETYPEKEDLLNALLVYGKYAQLYFDVDQDNLPTDAVIGNPNDILAELEAFGYDPDEWMVKYELNGKSATSSQMAAAGYVGHSLKCYSQIQPRHVFDKEKVYEFFGADTYCLIRTDGSRGFLTDYRIRAIPGIPAAMEVIGMDSTGEWSFAPSDWDYQYAIYIINDRENYFIDGSGSSMKITYSPLAYFIGAVKKSNDPDLVNFSAAAIKLFIEAKKVFG